MGLFDFFRGYVVFEAVGGFGERFLNLCRMRHVDIKNVKIGIGKITGELSMKKTGKLKDIAENSGVTIEIKAKKGLPVIFAARKHRLALAVGSVSVLFAMLFMNSFVWCIESVGSERYSPEQLIEAAEATGLRIGTFVPVFDEVASARDIITAFGGTLQWGAVNIRGSKAVIEVRDFVDELEPYDGDEPCNIVASTDGVILSLEAQRGEPSVKKGSAVAEGDVLISGAVETKNKDVYFTNAKGSVTAMTQRSIKETGGAVTEYSYTSSHSYYCLQLLSFRIPLGFYRTDSSHHIFETESFLTMNSLKLPFSVSKITVAEYKEKEASGESVTETLARFSDREYSQFANTLILSKKLSFSRKQSVLTVKGEYSCIDFIGKRQEIIIENS